MRIVIATDAWEPQLNGVARTLKQTTSNLVQMGHEVRVIQPGLFKSWPCPFTKDVRLAYGITSAYLDGVIQRPCAVHISTEGPIGLSVRNYCLRKNIPFTTTYHTKYPEYMARFAYVPEWITRSYMRWFHNASRTVMVSTPSLMRSLRRMPVTSRIKIWSRGVDGTLFHPRPKTRRWSRPVGLYVGRVSAEKSIEEFLNLKLDIEKVVVGDGPILESLKRNHPQAIFTGALRGEELAQAYCNADVFVFPSKTDTFGLVVLEALACGIPVACYPVEGPGEIIGNGENPGIGYACWNLQEAVERCLQIKSSEACLEFAQHCSWQACTEQFFDNLVFGPEHVAVPLT